MGRFVRDIGLFVLLQAVVFGGLLAAFYRPDVSNPVVATVRHKYARLASAPSPRMLFVGGSSVHTGFDGATAESMSGYHAVNLGLIAALRLEYMLAEALAVARPGDLVVIAPEYGQLFRRFEGGNSAMALLQVLEARPANAAHLRWVHWKTILDAGAIPQLGFAVQQASDRLGDWLRGRKLDQPRSIRVTDASDLLEHRGEPSRPGAATSENVLRARVDVADMMPSVALINRFAAAARQRGVDVVFTWCPIPKVQQQRRRRQLALIEATLRDQLDVPIIGSPDDFTFPNHAFFDSPLHLGGDWMIERTRRFCALLNQQRSSAD